MTTRLTAEHRRAQILDAARNLSYDGGLYEWTLDHVAYVTGLSRPGVRYYFYSAISLRAEIIVAAIKGGDVPIVTQALAAVDPLVKDIPNELRAACGEHLQTHNA